MVRIRLMADTKEQVERVSQLLKFLLGNSVVLRQPELGTNPKYEGSQKWFVYGDIKSE